MKTAIIPVFGKVRVPELVERLAALPEVQRLRQVSLSNIDSCSLTAIGGVSRYEHGLGTAILASRLADALGLGDVFRAELIIAAGLHDVAAPGLGHLFEEGCELAGQPFDHERRLREIFLDQGSQYYQVYLGRELGCRKLMKDAQVRPRAVFDAIGGFGRCGPAINGSIDLDNIDNIARMLFRLGRIIDLSELERFTQIFSLSGDSIVVDKTRTDIFSEWLRLRRALYDILMPEPTDFAAKAMTKRAVATGLSTEGISLDDWYLTDFELLLTLREHDPTRNLVERLWVGDYFALAALYWIEGRDSLELLLHPTERQRLEHDLTLLVGAEMVLDYIIDKRERSIENAVPPARALVGAMCTSATLKPRQRELCCRFIQDTLATGPGLAVETSSRGTGTPSFPFMDK